MLMVVLDEVDGSSRRGCTPSRTGECREVVERVNGFERWMIVVSRDAVAGRFEGVSLLA